MFGWLESLVVILILAVGLFVMSGGIHCARRASTQALQQSEAYERYYRPGMRRPSWVPPPQMTEPPMAHYRSISRELVHSFAAATSPGVILVKAYPLTNPLSYPPGFAPNRANHPPQPAPPDAAHIV